MHLLRKKSRTGFTLIEILIVIGIIAMLAAVVLIAINPARQFAQARNTQRLSNITAILNAIGQRIADNKGVFAGGTPNCPGLPAVTASSSIHNGGGAATPPDIDLSCLTPTYVAEFPTDPSVTSGTDTKYDVSVDSSGRVQVCTDPSTAEPAISGFAGLCIKR